MAVYMIQAGGPNGPVKIGYGDPQSRLNDCQVGNHLELRIIRQFEGGMLEEACLHDRFSDLWIRGEWHNFSRSMLGDVGLVEILPPAVVSEVMKIPPSPEPNMDLIRSKRGLSAELAQKLGVTKQAISMWLRVPAERLFEVERITGIPRHALRPDLCRPFDVSTAA